MTVAAASIVVVALALTATLPFALAATANRGAIRMPVVDVSVPRSGAGVRVVQGVDLRRGRANRGAPAAMARREQAVMQQRLLRSLPRARRLALARWRWLRSAQATTQRDRSRLAYRYLSAAAARGVDVREFRKALSGADTSPAANPAVAGHVLRYLNRSEAIVSSPSGTKLAISSVPLTASHAGSVPGPVDLRLRRTRGGLAPVNPLVPVVIGARLGQGVQIGASGVRLTLIGADTAAQPMSASTVMFPNVGTDLDAEVATTSQGAELFATLRSRRSTQRLRYAVALPGGASLLPVPSGGVNIVRDGKVVASVLPPVASDAQGTGVPVTMAVDGSSLVLKVGHRSGDYAYPILVDPQVTVELTDTSGGSWSESLPLLGDRGNYSSSGPNSITASPGLYYGSPNSWLSWNWTGPSITANDTSGMGSATFYNVNLQLNDPTGTLTEAGVTVGGCQGSAGANLQFAAYNAPVSDMAQELTGNFPICSGQQTLYGQNWIVNGSANGDQPETATGGAVSNFGSFLVMVNYSCSTCTTTGPTGSEGYGPTNPSEHNTPRTNCGQWPVNCATGNQFETQTDLAIPGRGPALALTRTYNSLAAAQGATGLFGNGWSSSLTDSLSVNQTAGTATVTQANGSTVPFTISGSSFVAPGWVQASLVKNSDGTYTYTLADLTSFHFSSAGQLLSEADRNGEAITVGYDSTGRLTTLANGAGRTITLSYGSKRGGPVSQATDSSGRKVSYSYSNGNLVGVTNAAGGVWTFGYDATHRLISEKDPRGHTVTTVYNTANQVTSQTDPANRTRTWTYSPSETVIKNPDGTQTAEFFDGQLPTQIQHGVGSAAETITTFGYDSNENLAAVINAITGRVTTFTYDGAGNRTSATDPLGRVTRWTYDALNDVTSVTDPNNVTTTYAYDSHGNLSSVATPLTGTNQSRSVSFTRANASHPGDVTATTDPNGKTTSYGYDSAGDLTSVTDPLGNQTTYGYDSIGRRTSMVSPRGNVSGGTPSAYTTTYAYDTMSRLTSETDPLTHTQSWSYDPDGNLAAYTDADNHKTTYTYDPDNEPITITRPDLSTLQNTFDAAGNLATQTDGAAQTTSYSYDALERPVSVGDPLARATTYGYDNDGNLTGVTDPSGRTTTYAYDAAHELTSTSYSDGATPTVSYAYNADGQRTSMIDGTGTTTSTYDSLGRLTAQTSGAGQNVAYGYDLAGNLTSLTYPNGKTVGRSFDSDGRLASISDWLGNTTTFGYDPDSDPTSTAFPATTGDGDSYSYDHADQLGAITMTQGSTTLASLAYTRDPSGLVTNETQTGLPGQASTSYSYTPLDQLATAGAGTYSYDKADNPTQFDSTSGYTYDQANELTSSPTAAYTYDKLGERLTSTPTGSSPTTNTYDQAGRLITYTPPAGAPTTYTYNGDGLRATKTTGTSTSTFTWDTSSSVPLLLSDASNTYLYGPNGTPVEQIDSAGNPSYLHHDQLGSTRLITSPNGAVAGSFTYSAYGAQTGSAGTATTPLGYAGQYTDSETGLIYMRARYYDPTTGQFLTRDPAESLTRQPYAYGNDNPVNVTDPTGLIGLGDVLGVLGSDAACGVTWEIPVLDEATCGNAIKVTVGAGAALTAGMLAASSSDDNTGAQAVPKSHVNELDCTPTDSSAVGENPDRNPAQDKLLTSSDIRRLKDAGLDPHDLKEGGSTSDLYKDGDGNLYEKPKGGAGPGEPLGINVNNLR